MTPVNRSDMKAARHFANWVLWGTWFVLWLTAFLLLKAWFNSILPLSSNTIVAAVIAFAPSTFLMGIIVPVFLVLWHPKVRTASDIPLTLVATPQWMRDRPKPKMIPHTGVAIYNYPLHPFLTEGWQQRYFYIEDSQMEAKVAELCAEVLTQWKAIFPTRAKPTWFADLADQARDFLSRLQTCEFYYENRPSHPSEDAAYLEKYGRWPDEWYKSRGFRIPSGVDHDWYVPDPLTTVANAAMVAGVTYLSTVQPIIQHHKHHKH